MRREVSMSKKVKMKRLDSEVHSHLTIAIDEYEASVSASIIISRNTPGRILTMNLSTYSVITSLYRGPQFHLTTAQETGAKSHSTEPLPRHTILMRGLRT